MKALYITLGAVAMLAILSYVVTLIIFNSAFRRAENNDKSVTMYIDHIAQTDGTDKASIIRDGMTWILAAAHEELEMASRDGLKLHARFIPSIAPLSVGPHRVAVLVHGYHSLAELDFSSVVRFYSEHGFDVLLPDQRSHGKSEGRYITFGTRERYDYVDWCRLIHRRFGGDEKILLNGVSMGSTTALLAAAETDMPSTLTYILADCGYVSPRAIFNDVFHMRYRLPVFPILTIAELLCHTRARFSFDEFSTADAVKKIKVPILFIHGEADNFVSIRNTRVNYEACTAPKRLFTVPGAGHGMSYLYDMAHMNAELETIFDEYFM